MRDRKCERKIESLKVHCPNHNKGCKWTGELRNVEEHLKKDPTTSREDRVRGCGYQLSFCDKCEETVMYVRMKAHLEEDCIIACEFESVGCDFSGSKYQMPNHIQDDMLQHLSLVTRFVKRNNSSPRHSPEVKSYVYLAISVGIVLVCILAAILIHQQQKQNQINEHLSLLQDDWAALEKIQRIKEADINEHLSLLQDDWAALKKIQRIKLADLDKKLTYFGLQLNDLEIKLKLLKQDISYLRNVVEGLERFSVKSIYDIIKKFFSDVLPDYMRNFFPDYMRNFLPDYMRNFLPEYIRNFLPEYISKFFPKFLPLN